MTFGAFYCPRAIDRGLQVSEHYPAMRRPPLALLLPAVITLVLCIEVHYVLAEAPSNELSQAVETNALSALPPGVVDDATAESPEADASEVAPAAKRPARKAATAPVVTAPVRTDYDLRALVASPVPGVESSGFGWREDPFHRRRKFHKGTDYRADRGTPVFAAGAGTVVVSGRKGGYGKVVYIDHGNGVVTRYGHLRSIEVSAGSVVAAGGKIGEVGSTGRATGPHLHFEVRLDGRAVDPKVAMSLAELQRVDLETARRTAAVLLDPEVVAQARDPKSPSGKRAKSTRPERRGRAKRTQVLW